jgi:predicted glycogen debranching enzyme
MTEPAVGPACPERVGWRRGDPPEALLAREWLVTNGLGGYASGTLAGVPTRRYHGVLVAALPAPRGRVMMLNHVVERVRFPDGSEMALSGLEPPRGPLALPEHLVEVRLVNGRPRWRFEREGTILEKRLVVLHRQNSAHVVYRLLAAAGPVTLVLEPALHVRSHDDAVAEDAADYRFEERGPGVAVVPPDPRFPPLRLAASGGAHVSLVAAPRRLEAEYRVERYRGYDHQGTLHVPGRFEIELPPGAEASLLASAESWSEASAVSAAEAEALDDERRLRLLQQAAPPLRSGRAAELVLAADQFIITPRTRPADEVRLLTEGDDARTVIAGYPWFTDWGRDTMISLEGLALCTGRHVEARDILHMFAHHVREGLIPNLFPEGQSEGLYHTADATLWFFHALDRYERTTGEVETRRFLLPKLADIIVRHIEGTRFGIGVDPADGLLRQGAPGYQLTWMDAKVGDWVVTPRRGKAVEINALFYNALRLLERWLRERGDAGAGGALPLGADEVGARADEVRASFNRRFWYEAGQYLYDVVDVEGAAGVRDESLRPNQLLAISLPHPVLDRERWEPVLRAVRGRLATPFGVRSLAPGHPDYKARYDGDLRARDAAYHQGTVWGWLIGPLVDAWLKTFPDDRAGARELLEGLETELGAACIGSVSEIFDGEAPYTPRGCVAQAWSVAEALRAITVIADDS